MFESREVQISCFWLLGDIPIDTVDTIDTIDTMGTAGTVDSVGTVSSIGPFVLAGPSGLVDPFWFVGYRHNVNLDAYNPQ